MWTPVLLAVACTVTVVRGEADPCDPETYHELDDRKRSTGYLTQYPESPLCDMNLPSGWYRFTSGAGGMMPEQCPHRMQCGTVVPIWLNGSHPTVAEGVAARTACANFNSRQSGVNYCCDHSLLIGIKNCGTYYVYYLKPTPTCPTAYCAGYKPSCPVGMWSITGFPPCKEAYPNITTDPVLSGPIVAGNTFSFSCSVAFQQHDPDLAFDVQWTFDGKPDPAIPVQVLRDPARVAHLDGGLLQGHMGTSVGCRIRSRYLSNGNMTSPWLKSNTYWAGIRPEPGHLTVSEKEETKNVSMVSTIPILCDHNSECCIVLKLDVDGPKQNLVTSHACEYKVCSTDWDPATNEARIQVPVTASKDQIRDGDKDLQLAFENILSSGGGPYLQAFDGYKPQNVPVDVKDENTKSCTWTGDPHIHGMDHYGTYNLYDLGDYTMVENPNRNMEVQARTWPCNRGKATCVCGVAIREKDDIIRIDLCDQAHRPSSRRSPTVRVAQGLREGTVVQRSTDGRHIMVYLPSGMEVLVDDFSTSLNVHLTVPSQDKGQVRGICGTFDAVHGNEFTRRDGGTERECGSRVYCVPKRFTASWNNDKHDSLFNTLPPKTNDDYVPKYCSCDKDMAGAPRINCTARGDIPNHTLKCHECNTLNAPLPSFMDPTQGWTRRSLVYGDVDEPDPQFDMDQYKNFQAGVASFPTPSGITETNARTKCRQAMETSQLWSHCRHMPKVVNFNIDDCVTDIMYGNGLDFVEHSAASFLTECQVALSKNPNNYVTNTEGKSVLKPEVSNDVCSIFCFRHGRCVRGKCVCDHGYEGDNCNLIAGKGPQLEKIRSNRTCDINQRPCRTIFLDASNLEHKDTLACAANIVMDNGTLSRTYFAEPAQFLNAYRLACPLPDSQGRAVTTFSVKATNDGHLYGNSLLVTVFDSTCQSCDQKGHCTQLNSTCLIDGYCHQDGDLNPRDETLMCDSSTNTSHWTVRPTQQPGNFPKINSVTLSGPDDDLQMRCAVNTSATGANARFRVTWFFSKAPRASEIVTASESIAYFNLYTLQGSGELSCEVRSFYEGSSEVSPPVNSLTTKTVQGPV